MKRGIERIADERKRQMEGEGWTPENEDEYKEGQLAILASAYAIPPIAGEGSNDNRLSLALKSMWSLEGWELSPDGRIRELEKAGALIVAEIDRLQRLTEGKRECR